MKERLMQWIDVRVIALARCFGKDPGLWLLTVRRALSRGKVRFVYSELLRRGRVE